MTGTTKKDAVDETWTELWTTIVGYFMVSNRVKEFGLWAHLPRSSKPAITHITAMGQVIPTISNWKYPSL